MYVGQKTAHLRTTLTFDDDASDHNFTKQTHSYLVSVRLLGSLNQLMTANVPIPAIIHQSYIRYPEVARKGRCTTFACDLGVKLHYTNTR